MKKKIFSLVLLFVLFGNPFSFTFAKSKVIYERSEKLAKQYIENSLNDDNWKDKNPYISGEGKKFYTDDEKNPSYIEFKISCDNEINCGFILVNSDGNDVVVPIASTSGIGPGELLSLQNEDKVNKKNKENKTNKKSNNKLYYFGPLEQYSIDEENEEVISINPQDEIDLVIENDKTLKKEDKEKQKGKVKQELKNRINDYKIKAKEYKKSDEFKKHKEEIKDQILKMPKEEFVFEKLDMAFANVGDGGTGYNPTVYSSDTFIPGINYSGCKGKVPCYKQFNYSYNGQNCLVGCVPLAYSIIYGYYDRRGDFPNLVDGVGTTLNSTNIDEMTKKLGKDYLGTRCLGGGGATSSDNLTLGIGYAKSKGYINSIAGKVSSTNTSFLFQNIKSEINLGRPLIGNTSNHAIVIFGYYNSSNTNIKICRANVGGGSSYNFTDSNYNIYYGSNIDYNIDSIYYSNAEQGPIKSIVKVIISN